MKKSLPAISGPPCLPDHSANGCQKLDENQPAPAVRLKVPRAIARCTSQSGKLHSQFAAYLAFAAAVLVSLLAVFTVVSHDLPLMLWGF